MDEIQLVLFNVKIHKTPLELLLKDLPEGYLLFKQESEVFEFLQAKNKTILFLHIFNQKTLVRSVQLLKLLKIFIKKHQVLVVAINEMPMPEIERRLLSAGIFEFIDFFINEKTFKHKLDLWKRTLHFNRVQETADGQVVRVSGRPMLRVEEDMSKLPVATLLKRVTHQVETKDSGTLQVLINGEKLPLGLEDADSQLLVLKTLNKSVNVPVGPVSLKMSFTYKGKVSSLQLAGEVTGYEPVDDGHEFYNLAFTEAHTENVRSFLHDYHERQRDIAQFLNVAKGF